MINQKSNLMYKTFKNIKIRKTLISNRFHKKTNNKNKRLKRNKNRNKSRNKKKLTIKQKC